MQEFALNIAGSRLLDSFHPAITAQRLLDASNAMTSGNPTVVVDGGVENYNATVDELIQSGTLKRVLAQTGIRSSNSMIESWWRVLKHQWLYLNQLDSVKAVDVFTQATRPIAYDKALMVVLLPKYGVTMGASDVDALRTCCLVRSTEAKPSD